MHKVYVNAMAQVSRQQPLSDEWFDNPILFEESYMRAAEPNSKGLIMPAEARRMSRILKRAVCTSITALNNSEIQMPDAIITGTGMGCMENSEKFLNDMCDYGETGMKPSLFMHSTHNTISSLIAIILKCHGYNNTYSHKGRSFESALFDAWLQIGLGNIRNALVGAHDEVTPLMNLIMEDTHPEYGFVSESSFSAILSDKPGHNSICEVESVELINTYNPDEIAAIIEKHSDDLLLTGINGVQANDHLYEDIFERISSGHILLRYKNIFGDNFSSPAMSFYSAALILQKQRIPEFLIDRKHNPDNYTGDVADIDSITILNNSDGNEWSVIRLIRHQKPTGGN